MDCRDLGAVGRARGASGAAALDQPVAVEIEQALEAVFVSIHGRRPRRRNKEIEES